MCIVCFGTLELLQLVRAWKERMNGIVVIEKKFREAEDGEVADQTPDMVWQLRDKVKKREGLQEVVPAGGGMRCLWIRTHNLGTEVLTPSVSFRNGAGGATSMTDTQGRRFRGPMRRAHRVWPPAFLSHWPLGQTNINLWALSAGPASNRVWCDASLPLIKNFLWSIDRWWSAGLWLHNFPRRRKCIGGTPPIYLCNRGYLNRSAPYLLAGKDAVKTKTETKIFCVGRWESRYTECAT